MKEEKGKLGKELATGMGEGGCVLKNIDTIIIIIHFKKIQNQKSDMLKVLFFHKSDWPLRKEDQCLVRVEAAAKEGKQKGLTT